MSDCKNQNPGIITSDVKGILSQGCLFKKHTPEKQWKKYSRETEAELKEKMEKGE